MGQGLDKPAQEVTALAMEVFVKVTPLILLMEKYSLRGNGNSVPDSVTTWATYPNTEAQSLNNYNLECECVWTCVCMWAYMGCQCTYTGSASHKKCFLPPRTLLSQLFSHHHLWAWEMPIYFNNISHRFIGRKICCRKKLCDVFQNQK